MFPCWPPQQGSWYDLLYPRPCLKNLEKCVVWNRPSICVYEQVHAIYIAQKDIRHQSSPCTTGRCTHPSRGGSSNTNTQFHFSFIKHPDPLRSGFTPGFSMNIQSTVCPFSLLNSQDVDFWSVFPFWINFFHLECVCVFKINFFRFHSTIVNIQCDISLREISFRGII